MDGMIVVQPQQRGGYQRAILAEIRMLFDYVAATPGTSLSDLEIPGDDQFHGGSKTANILRRMEEAEADLHKSNLLGVDKAAFLYLIRDAMVRKAWPASGLTVAFTALVADEVRGSRAESRASLARDAYPGLVPLARFERGMRLFLLILAIVMTLVAGWESAKVALGRSLLETLGGLRQQQAEIAAERNRIETSIDDHDGDGLIDAALARGKVPLTAFSLCNRSAAIAAAASSFITIPDDPGMVEARDAAVREAAKSGTMLRNEILPPVAKLKMYGSSVERAICEKDHVLAYSFSLVHSDLERYRTDWAGMVGSVFAITGRLYGGTICRILPCAPTAVATKPGEDDVEFIIAPVLMVWGNYALPVIFGLLGSIIFVLLDIYNKMRHSLLHPRDSMLSGIRLVLGMVTGACVGLFFSSSGPVSGGAGAGLAQGLTLSASGIAFLAGFGVEGVFLMLEGLVRQVFPAGQQAAKYR